ncbi:hypothetical protein B566_EDAN011486 [Ephemera danica]|nr:hypothetical protein B566_EDAN011486 [Ephemera danica]
MCHAKIDWVKMNRNQRLPSNALPGGRTKEGDILYIGRATFIGNDKVTILGKIDWVKMNRNQRLPSNALPGGRTKEGDILYIGRATFIGNDKVTILGKVDQDLMCCVPYYDKEHKYPEYELLVIKQD